MAPECLRRTQLSEVYFAMTASATVTMKQSRGNFSAVFSIW